MAILNNNNKTQAKKYWLVAMSAGALLLHSSVQAAIQPAVLTSEADPNYPFDYRKNSVEGWAQVSFVVDPTGRVKDPIIHDSSGHELFESSAIEAVQQWQYTPANLQGEAVAQSINGVQLNFRLDTVSSYDEDLRKGEVDKRFLSRFQKGMKSIQKGKMKDAAKRLKELQDREKRKWIESSYLWVLEGYYFEKAGDSYSAALAFSKVMDNGSQILPRALYIEVLKKAFTANVMNNNLVEAKTVYDRFSDYAPGHDALNALKDYYDQVNSFIDSEQPLEVVGMIPNRGAWHHQLTRWSATIASAGEPLAAVELRCDYKQQTYSEVAQQTFSMPAEWGTCVVYVSGKSRTQFVLTES